jgi:hypothetical protein
MGGGGAIPAANGGLPSIIGVVPPHRNGLRQSTYYRPKIISSADNGATSVICTRWGDLEINFMTGGCERVLGASAQSKIGKPVKPVGRKNGASVLGAYAAAVQVPLSSFVQSCAAFP